MRFTLPLIAALAASPALAEETLLTLQDGIAATLNMPEGEGPFPAILMLHGFGSSRDEVGGMFAMEAAALAEAGIASLRIDFRGFGQSGGDTGHHTVDRQNEDAEIGLSALLATDGVDAERIGVLGFSFGGGAAIQLAAARSEVKSLVTWSSVGDYDTDFLQSMGQETFDRAADEGIVGLDLGWRTMALKDTFFASLSQHNILTALAQYSGPFLGITGSEDYYTMYSTPMAGAAAGADVEAVVIDGADHIFNVFDADATSAEQVITLTTERFASTL
ncbi:alpha/beta hydrolase family protein [Pararhodobacter oceanensis]|uniref:alpha/beta hydrolase family protein n=1 Tax=Pararhodobacter oceanensis TaxID=2172121 RepID=UPI003A9320A4